MSDKIPELKPCPFCGGEAKPHKGLVAFNDCEVQCETCGFAGPNFGALDEVPNPIENAILHWNTRTAPKVKPLVWDEDKYGDLYAVNAFGKYEIVFIKDEGWCVYLKNVGVLCTERKYLCDAKEFAQNDSKNRALSLIE